LSGNGKKLTIPDIDDVDTGRINSLSQMEYRKRKWMIKVKGGISASLIQALWWTVVHLIKQ